MKIISDVNRLRDCTRAWRKQDEKIGFVPTMGNLHAGHLRLVERAQTISDRVVASIFVNPLQFGPNEDFQNYPRTFDEDAEKLRRLGVDLLFAPTVEVMYPAGTKAATTVSVPDISDVLCGAHRPGHFSGVATVVARLFNMVEPDLAVFGEKDFQQLTIIRRMVEELAFPVEVIGEPTVREADGLAMSSRNQYLTAEERGKATLIYRLLKETADSIKCGNTDFRALERAGLERLAQTGFKPDYFEIRREQDLQPAENKADSVIVFIAAWLGKARLIDNLRVSDTDSSA